MKKLILLLITASLVACGGGSGNSGQPAPQPAFSPEVTNLSSMKLVDASGAPLANASVTITPVTAGAQMAAPAMVMTSAVDSQNLTTDQYGNLTLNDLAPGTYKLTITIGGVTVTSIIEITSGNADESATVAAPVVLEEGGAVSLQDEFGENLAVFASISGVVYSATGPVSGAQISVSGGEATNGPVASDVTDENGRYLLIINVSLDKLEAMESATLRIVKDGFINLTHTFNTTTALAFVGQNYSLQAATAGGVSVMYSDDFNQTANGATCGTWTTSALALDDGIIDETPDIQPTMLVEGAEPDMINLWHQHGAGLNITNSALTENLVKLAPDDSSAGKIPEPFGTGACWYGQAAGNNISTGTGNFLGTFNSTQGGDDLDGGESDEANGGVLVSPILDLTNETAPLALSFRTWWEIESVNPNENGFDLMIIEYSLNGGDTWNSLARLNPLTDPVSGCIDRAPLPFSNRGFNRAPAWLWQEPIDISELAGEANAKIRFVFRTQDELYNGFRGWLIDDVRITGEQGTFPRYHGGNESPDEDFSDSCGGDNGSGDVQLMQSGSRPGRNIDRPEPVKNMVR